MDLDKNTEPIDLEKVEAAASAKAAELTGDGLYLFTTKTCPNCRLAKQYLNGKEYTIVDAEENPEIAKEWGIMAAPTLVVQTDGHRTKYANASNIKRFAEYE